MDTEKGLYVHTVITTTSQEAYLISEGDVPTRVVVILNGTLTDNVTAYDSIITDEVVDTWKAEPCNAKLPRHLFLEEVKKALVGGEENKGFSYELLFTYFTPQRLALSNIMDIKNPTKLLEVPLQEIPLSKGVKYFSLVGEACKRMLKQKEDETAKILTLEKEKEELKNMLRALTVDRNHWEDRTLRAFSKILNEKKRRIQELEGIEPKKKKPRPRKISSSDDDTQEYVVDSSDEYDRDTQVDDFVSQTVKDKNKSLFNYNVPSSLKEAGSSSGSDTDFEENNSQPSAAQASLSPLPQADSTPADDLDKTYFEPEEEEQKETVAGQGQDSAIVPMETENQTKNNEPDTGDEFEDDNKLLDEFCDL